MNPNELKLGEILEPSRSSSGSGGCLPEQRKKP